MGTFNQSVDFAAIGAEMAKTSGLWMNAEVEIFDPNVSDSDWDPYTNTETPGTETTVWSGPARIQPVGGVATPDVGFVQSAVRQVRIQVPLDESAGFIRKGLQVRVTSAGNDYALDGMVFTINQAINSSYAWLRTLLCDADLRLGPDGV